MYLTREIEIPVRGALLSGTLVLPRAVAEPFPALLLLGGSGVHDRDSELHGFSLLRLLAGRLARAGVASLRWDDRGVGLSTGKRLFETTEELASDAIAAIRILECRQEIERGRIGLLGHSAGGLVATVAALRSRVMCVVLLASPVVSCEALLFYQAQMMAKWAYRDTALVERALGLLENILQAARGEIEWRVVERGLEDQFLSDAAGESLPSSRELASRVAESLGLARSRWYRHFIDHRPFQFLSRLDTPVMALFAEYDWQVSARGNLAAARHAFAVAGNRDVFLKIYPKANHLFVQAVTGSPAEYRELSGVPVARLLEDVTSWVVGRASAEPRSGASRCIRE